MTKEANKTVSSAHLNLFQEGEEYQFRVKAKNKAGTGDPSDASNSVICKPRNLAPVIDRSAIQEIKVGIHCLLPLHHLEPHVHESLNHVRA